MKSLRLTGALCLVAIFGLFSTQAIAASIEKNADGTTYTIKLGANEHLADLKTGQLSSKFADASDNAVNLIIEPEEGAEVPFLTQTDFDNLDYGSFAKVKTLDISQCDFNFNRVNMRMSAVEYIRTRNNTSTHHSEWYKNCPKFKAAVSYISGSTDTNDLELSFCVKSPQNGSNEMNLCGKQFGFISQYNNNLPAVTRLKYFGKLEEGDVTTLLEMQFNTIYLDLAETELDKVEESKLKFNTGRFQVGLKGITLPTNMTYIPDNCLQGCKLINTVKIPDHVTYIGASAFEECKGLTTINLPNGVDSIASKAFHNSCLQAISLPNTLRKIEEEAFMGCNWLTSIIIPASVTYIGKQAFHEVNSLKDIYCLGTTPPVLGEGAFRMDNYGINYNLSSYVSQDATTANREDYWKNDPAVGNAKIGNNQYDGVTMLHYPKSAADAYTDVRRYDENYINVNYTDPSGPAIGYYYTSTDKLAPRYPTQAQMAYIYNNFKGWKQFPLTTAFTPGKDIPVVPNVKDNTWYTIIFPFDVTRTMLETTFGGSTELCKLYGVEQEALTEGNTEYTIYSVRFERAFDYGTSGNIEAPTPNTPGYQVVAEKNYPYLIHPGQLHYLHDIVGNVGNITGYEMIGADYSEANVRSQEPVPYNTRQEANPTRDYKETVAATYIGTYDGTELLPYKCFYLGINSKGNEAFKLQGNKSSSRTGKWKQYTCIIQLTDESGNTKLDNFITEATQHTGAKGYTDMYMPDAWGDVDTDLTTGISTVKYVVKNDQIVDNNIYNLQGQKVGNDKNNLNNLPKGIYIIGGKKYIVR